jgi:hypothetical protein
MMTNCVYKNINGCKIDKPQFVINKNVNLHKIKGTMGQFGPMVLKYNKIIKKGGYKFFILYFCIF